MMQCQTRSSARGRIGIGLAAALWLMLLASAAVCASALKVLVPPMPAAEMADLHRAAPNVELVVARSEAEALAKVGEVDGVYGFVSPAIVKAGKRLRWIQVGFAGVEGVLFPEMMDSQITLTNAQ